MRAMEGKGSRAAFVLAAWMLSGACGRPACVGEGPDPGLPSPDPGLGSVEEQALDLARAQLLARWRAERTAQSLGPPEWRAQASAAWQEELGLKAFDSIAGGLLAEPDELGWSWLSATASRWPQQTGLSATQARALLALQAPAGEGVEAAAWRAAWAWSALALGQPEQALERLGSPSSVDLLGLSARLRALQQLAQDPQDAALALHRAFPADREGCRSAGRGARARLEFLALDEVVEGCLDLASAPYLSRLQADALDAQGRSAEACALYLEAGADLHAAAILVQDGRCGARAPADLVRRALGEDSAEARLHTLWEALISGEPGRIDEAASAMLARGEDRGPPARAVLAAAWLARDQPFAAGVLLDSGAGSSAPVLILRARVAQALALAAGKGERAGASEAAMRLADEAVAASPDELGAHQARMRLRAALDPTLLPAAVTELAARDPVALEILSRSVDRMLPWRGVSPGGWPMDALDPTSRRMLEATLGAAPVAVYSLDEADLMRHRFASSLLRDPAPDPDALRALAAALVADSKSDTWEPEGASLAAAARIVAGDPPSPRWAGLASSELSPLRRWALTIELLAAGEGEQARTLLASPGPPGEDPLIQAVLRASLARALDTRQTPSEALDTVRLLD